MNHLLSSLPAENSFVDNLETVHLAERQELERPNRPIEYVYFMEHGIAAVMSRSGETQIAVGIIGCEGSSGIAVFMGDYQSPHLTMMLTEGTAQRIDAGRLREILNRDPELKRSLLRYALAFYNQAAHTALSNAASSLEERAARWILMADDRLPHNEIPLTHERVAAMLHARRAGITAALHALQSAGLVEVKRSLIEILDRKGLEVVAGRFYGRPEVEFTRLIGTFWPPVPKQR